MALFRKIKSHLSLQVLLWISLVLFLIISIDTYLSWKALDVRFQSLERAQVSSKLKIANSLVEDRIKGLARAAGDYSNWDETWNFMLTPNTEFERTNVSKEVLRNLDIDGFWLVHMDRSVRVAAFGSRLSGDADGAFSISYKRFPQIDQVLRSIDWPRVQAQITSGQKAGQFILAGEQALMVGIAPILHNDESGPQRGYALMIRVLDKERYSSLFELSNFSFNVMPEQNVKNAITFEGDHILSAFTNTTPTRYGFTVAINEERASTSQRIEILWLLILNLFVIWLVATFALVKGVSKIIVSRILAYVATLKGYTESSSGIRLKHKNIDELDTLAEHMNVLMGRAESHRDRLVHEATHDPLTQLANRALLAVKIEEAKISARASGKCFALILIDLDHFKNINDIHGHSVGDDILQVLGQRLRGITHESACIARLGGDEFAILLPEISRVEEAQLLANNILLNLQSGLMSDRLCFNMTASIGVVFVENRQIDNTYNSILMKKADIAMYRAKQYGRNRVTIFADWMLEFLEENSRLEAELATALTNDEIDFVIQPIVNANDLSLKEFEILARWNHPRLGLVMPGTFIPVAENAHMMRQLTLELLNKACQRCRSYILAHPGSRMSVNVSIQELLEDGFVEELELVLRQNDFSGGWLNLEITESLLESNENSLLGPMNYCAGLGINFHLDDFGTGYSSLARLHTLPFTSIKVDRSFINRLGFEGDAIVEAIVRMAHALSLKVICEGVETRAQLDMIRQLNADSVQGYWVAKPMKFSDFESWTAVDREFMVR
ncbi:EAL domain-containing protein [Leeia sp. TBRC 13508]|uniref:EAL domain-containing protein n=1 Tax=Leeia speluncae TaxID=2884804 RepID=A0ABS8D7J6_9NEIS|nr:EAL domain-containing protein [Leeia speluncae]MCB6184162.1 EAL domain-containing protein [Leeia speluncae]